MHDNQIPFEEWMEAEGKTDEAVTVEQLDALVKDYQAKREAYEAAKKIASEKHGIYEEAENKLVNTLKAAGKKSYKVDGVGNAIITHKSVIQVPKDTDSKRALWQWIESNYGVDSLHEMLSINSMKLTSWYNQEVERHKDDPLFSIPGIAAPTVVENLSFRRETK